MATCQYKKTCCTLYLTYRASCLFEGKKADHACCVESTNSSPNHNILLFPFQLRCDWSKNMSHIDFSGEIKLGLGCFAVFCSDVVQCLHRDALMHRDCIHHWCYYAVEWIQNTQHANRPARPIARNKSSLSFHKKVIGNAYWKKKINLTVISVSSWTLQEDMVQIFI